ncbi:MAG TPA: DUF4124 domain-containing protein [Burkholderiales bacterium]|nr:DUF4124 domain-containing protein [Burkholderiales bacterium]
MKPLLKLICVLIAAVLLQPAAAQVLYKSTMPDGRIVYGDKPDPDAVKVEETQPDISKRGIGGTTPREKEVLREMEKSRAQREADQGRVQAAEQALRNAEAARAAGKEPLEGERIGTAGGASRLSEAYDERQRRLDEAVVKARSELEAARAGR